MPDYTSPHRFRIAFAVNIVISVYILHMYMTDNTGTVMTNSRAKNIIIVDNMVDRRISLRYPDIISSLYIRIKSGFSETEIADRVPYGRSVLDVNIIFVFTVLTCNVRNIGICPYNFGKIHVRYHTRLRLILTQQRSKAFGLNRYYIPVALPAYIYTIGKTSVHHFAVYPEFYPENV